MTDLTTNYLGLRLRNPVVASAGPLSQTVPSIRSLADAGVGAVVMYSLFEEQVRREAEKFTELTQQYQGAVAEAGSFFPEVNGFTPDDTDGYRRLLEVAAESVDIPVIASINGSTKGGWTRYARELQDSGAAAIELNIYLVPGDLTMTGDQVEQRHLEILQAVKEVVSIPVAVKLAPYFSSIGNFCVRLDRAGADGLVLFNRFLQPDIDVDRMRVESGITLSTQNDSRLPRTWIAVLHNKVKASLAATSGVETADDVVKYLLAGADVVMTTSSLVRHGAGHATRLIEGLTNWLERHEIPLDQARGMLAVPDDATANQYQREGYLAVLNKAKSTYGSLRE